MLIPRKRPLGMEAQDAFSTRWGGMPTAEAIKMRQQGKAPAPAAPPATDVQPQGPSLGPREAGIANAAQPGFFNGNPGIGVPKAEVGFNRPAGEIGGRDSAPPGVTGTPIPQGLGPQPPVAPRTPIQRPPQNPAIGRVGQMIRDSMMGTPLPQPGTPPIPTPQPGTPPMPMPVAPPAPTPPPQQLPQVGLYGAPASPQLAAMAAAAAPAVGKAAEMAPMSASVETAPWQTDDRSMKEKFGTNKLPDAWNSWSKDRKEQWKANHYQPPAQAPPPTAPPPPTGETPTTPPPPTGEAPPQGGTPQPTSPPTTGDPGTVADGGYYNKGGDYVTWDDERADWQNFKNAGGTYEDWVASSGRPALGYFDAVGGKKPENVSKTEAPSAAEYTAANQPVTIPPDFAGEGLDFGNDYLTAIGMDMHRTATELANATQSGANVPKATILKWQEALKTGTSVLARYGITYDPASVINFEGGGGPGNAPPGHSDDRSDMNLGDTDIRTKFDFSTISGDLKRALNRIGIDTTKLSDATLLEFATNTGLWENDQQNRQKGINLMQGALDQTLVENNPFRKESEAAMLEALRNPDPTPWDQIKNRYATDVNRGTQDIYGGLNTSAARRGLSPGDVAGFGAMLGTQQKDTLARGLGEIEAQQAATGRASLYDALSMAGNVDRNYRGAESVARQALANMVVGAPSMPGNPYAGVGNTATNLAAIQQAYDAQKEAERQADKARTAGLIGGGISALGTIFGGPLGGALGNSLFGGGGAPSSTQMPFIPGATIR